MVRSSTGVRGMATREIEVIGIEGPTIEMRIATLATAIWLTLLGTIALAQSVTYDYDRAANFSNYKTYAWTRGTELPTSSTTPVSFEPSMPPWRRRVSRAWNPAPTPTCSSPTTRALTGTSKSSGRRTGGGRWVSAETGGVRRGFSRCWSGHSSSTSPTHGKGRSCGGAWPAATSGPTDKPESRDRKIAKGDGEDVQELPASTRKGAPRR